MSKRRSPILVSSIFGMAVALGAMAVPRFAHADAPQAVVRQSSQDNVKLVVDGMAPEFFAEARGPGVGVEVIEDAGTADGVVRKRPGAVKYSNIVLRRAYTAGSEGSPLAGWLQQVVDGKTDRKSGSIIYLDREGGEALRLNLFEAWPSRRAIRNVIDPVTKQSQIVEEIELVVEKVERGK